MHHIQGNFRRWVPRPVFHWGKISLESTFFDHFHGKFNQPNGWRHIFQKKTIKTCRFSPLESRLKITSAAFLWWLWLMELMWSIRYEFFKQFVALFRAYEDRSWTIEACQNMEGEEKLLKSRASVNALIHALSHRLKYAGNAWWYKDRQYASASLAL